MRIPVGPSWCACSPSCCSAPGWWPSGPDGSGSIEIGTIDGGGHQEPFEGEGSGLGVDGVTWVAIGGMSVEGVPDRWRVFPVAISLLTQAENPFGLTARTEKSISEW